MLKTFEVLWTENSIQDLLEIKNFISQDSATHAESWISELITKGENLKSLPQRGRVVPEFETEHIRELIIDNYRIVYRINTNSVEILTIFESHRQLKKEHINK